MISCLLIQVLHDAQGLSFCKKSITSGESIQIGRSSSCGISLLDHRAKLIHATINRSEDGTLCLDGEMGASIRINGSIEQIATLSPGMRIEIGPYLLTVEPAPDGHDIALSVEIIQTLLEQDAEKTCRTAPTTLAGLGLSKRKFGLILAVCIIFLFLLLPILPGISSAIDKWQSSLPITLTGSWSPGPLAGGHNVFGAKCSTCHQHPFRPVPDDACSECHKQVEKHLAKKDLHANIFKKVRCTSCHLDHIGQAGLVLHNSSGCVSCHGDLKRRNADTTRGNVRDFGSDHPPFHITLQDGKNSIRIQQTEKGKLIEKSQLKYSHQVHLDKKGVSTPLGRTVMVCQDCHKIDAAGTHFAPMTMRMTCQQSRCHTLYFTEPVEGKVPHGSESEVMNKAREFYARWLADSPAKNKEACAQTSSAGNTAQQTLECASDLAQKYVARTLFKESGEDLECGLCHEIEPTGENDVPWKIVPLQITRDFQPGAVFAHSKHDTLGCTECHDKTGSRSSADVAMPTIEKCRECHAGSRTAKGKVRSTCDSCHLFHPNLK
jgi:hypothetical protein